MSANTSEPTPLGTLFKLPPELRDRIYNDVLDESYVVFWDYYKKHDSEEQGPNDLADIEILCISKTLSAEASARLFSNKTKFIFLISFNPYHNNLSPPLERKVTERMMNVELRVDSGGLVEAEWIRLDEYRMWPCDRSMLREDIIRRITPNGDVKLRRQLYCPSNMNLRCESSVEHFTGTEIERNKLLVTFSCFDERFHHFIPTRFFQTLKKCIGFRSIAVVLKWWDIDGDPPKSMAVAKKIEKVRRELEQCWGPCVVRDALEQYTQRVVKTFQLYFVFELVFEPLKFRADNMLRRQVLRR